MKLLKLLFPSIQRCEINAIAFNFKVREFQVIKIFIINVSVTKFKFFRLKLPIYEEFLYMIPAFANSACKLIQVWH